MLIFDHFTQIESYLPHDLSDPHNVIYAFFIVLFTIILRYFIFAGLFYHFFWNTSQIKYPALHDRALPKNQIYTEIKYSIISSVFFALAGLAIGLLWQGGYTKIYLDFNLYGYSYLICSFILLTLTHEVYFYFTHRLMHHKRLFKHIHHIHHISRKTSPWASFSFHPTEAIITALFLPIVCLILPVHPTMLILYLVFMTLSAISNHLGYELVTNRTFSRFFISGKHHQLHHTDFNSNYGLYYCFMDILFKTDSDKN